MIELSYKRLRTASAAVLLTGLLATPLAFTANATPSPNKSVDNPGLTGQAPAPKPSEHPGVAFLDCVAACQAALDQALAAAAQQLADDLADADQIRDDAYEEADHRYEWDLANCVGPLEDLLKHIICVHEARERRDAAYAAADAARQQASTAANAAFAAASQAANDAYDDCVQDCIDAWLAV